ncbi:putative cis-zeatin O-glucosyltransferase [Iris pallida]|uniref:Glycosyltransferase n=1 Tax=Iris pallida TaxID=29817 RepID=A0AAX6IF42_IRIPA|nr:putative cis-zeatin O-glucosyltransferase [Iris pallida]
MSRERREEMEQVKIVMVPFAAQGHLNQLLHFAINLSSTYVDLPVHYACSASYVRQAKSRIQGRDSASLEKVHFHELPLPPFPSPPPDPAANFPSHLVPSFEAAMELRAPLAALFLSLSVGCRRLVVVHDPMMSFVSSDVASLPNAESYRFQCVPSYNELQHFCRQPDYDASRLRREVLDVILDPFEGCFSPEFRAFVVDNYIDVAAEAGTLFNSCRTIDGEFLDLLSGVPRYRGKKLFAVGPLNPLAIERGLSSHKCLEWLDEQPPASVLYVSFGSTSTMSDEQIERLATGLERSGQRFIWVLRDADLGDIFAADGDGGNGIGRRELPAGFEERVKGRGMVVRGWAPQLPILAHPSTGGFMSHCGWNSCMESLSMGVPIVAWPVHSDQPRNAVMVTEYLRTGVAVREWARLRDPVSSEAIEKAIGKVMVVQFCDEEGKEMRKRARLLGEAIRLSVAEGGSSRADMDSFVQHITRDA